MEAEEAAAGRRIRKAGGGCWKRTLQVLERFLLFLEQSNQFASCLVIMYHAKIVIRLSGAVHKLRYLFEGEGCLPTTTVWNRGWTGVSGSS